MILVFDRYWESGGYFFFKCFPCQVVLAVVNGQNPRIYGQHRLDLEGLEKIKINVKRDTKFSQ